MSKILVTGAAGFIGFHLVQKLVQSKDHQIVGIDSINSYYDPALKYSRLVECGLPNDISENAIIHSTKYPNYRFAKIDITNNVEIEKLFEEERFDIVVNLAAQAGVRYALENPRAYLDSNISGFFNILEASSKNKIKHLLFASSSSVYGLNEKVPFSEHHSTAHPASLYAATKKANEVLAHSYSHIHHLPVTGLRFFTVYGPWGRPDMALFKFTKNILEDKEIEIYGHGEMLRDFTYVDDIADGIERLLNIPPVENDSWNARDSDPATSSAPYRILNIGRGDPVNLMDFIHILEEKLNKKAKYKYLDIQPGEVKTTFADTTELERLTNHKARINIRDGVSNFVDWYLSYYK